MLALDSIATERQRLAERLARIDAERTKLTEQLAELEAAERVLLRLSPAKAASPRRGTRARTAQAMEPVSSPARRRGSGRGGRKAVAKAAVPLGAATLRAIGALGSDVSAGRSASISGNNSECRCVRTTSAWPCSAIAAAAGSVSATEAGRWRTEQTRRRLRHNVMAKIARPGFWSAPDVPGCR